MNLQFKLDMTKLIGIAVLGGVLVLGIGALAQIVSYRAGAGLCDWMGGKWGTVKGECTWSKIWAPAFAGESGVRTEALSIAAS